MTNKETRSFGVAELKVERRSADDTTPAKLVGYAAKFNQRSEKLGWFYEEIAQGAFADSLQNDDVRALWNHDSAYVLGRKSSGTLELSEDEVGLRVAITPPDAQWARDLMVSVERGDVSQMSFGFQTITDEWRNVDDAEVRTLKKVRLLEVSPVTFPAYPQTEIAKRSHEGWCETQKPLFNGTEYQARARHVCLALARQVY